MTKSTKILVLVLALIGLFGLAADPFCRVVFGEVEAKQAALQAATRHLELQTQRLRRAETDCEVFDKQLVGGLPSDPAKATIIYQEYLVRLAESCGLKSVVISNAQPEVEESLGFVLQFSVQGRGNAGGIGKFVSGFHQTAVLHRFSHLNIFQSLGPDSPEHSFSVDIEALSLTRRRADTTSSHVLAVPSSLKIRDLFSRRDIFRRPRSVSVSQVTVSAGQGSSLFAGMSSPQVVVQATQEVEPPPPTKPKPPPAPKLQDVIRLVGIIKESGDVSAVFYNPINDQQITVSGNESLGHFGVESRILEIKRNSILVELARQEAVEWSMGEVFSEAQIVTKDQ